MVRATRLGRAEHRKHMRSRHHLPTRRQLPNVGVQDDARRVLNAGIWLYKAHAKDERKARRAHVTGVRRRAQDNH